MYRVILICFLFIVIVACKDEKKTTSNTEIEKATTYYLIRHAEKDRSDSTTIDPNLTEKGFQRAKHWATYFDSIPLHSVYSTNYIRTSNTASYTAAAKDLLIDLYNPDTLVSQNFLNKTKGQNILIVGHSNTTPVIANQLLGEDKYENMNDSDNSSLYVVTIKGNTKKSAIRKVEI